MPNYLREERKLWKRGYKRVACLDEAGRGPLAGPVVACACLFRPGLNSSSRAFPGIRDSKKLTPKRREEFYKILTGQSGLEWKTCRVSERVIDRINILEATKLAMEKALRKMKKKPDFLILDGNFRIKSDIPQKSIIRADEKVFSCMAAGIIAKVTRDRTMKRYHRRYPDYGFDRHKGYSTGFHRCAIKKNGLSKIHRKSFKSS